MQTKRYGLQVVAEASERVVLAQEVEVYRKWRVTAVNLNRDR